MAIGLAPSAAAAVLNVGGMTSLVKSVLIVGVLVAAAGVLFRAHKGEFGKIVGVVVVVLIGAVIAALSTGGNFTNIGNDLFHLIFN